MGYYRYFVLNYSKIAWPLLDLTKKGLVWRWDPAQHKAFKELKMWMCCSPVLTKPNFNEHFYLQTDASVYSVGAILSQKGKTSHKYNYEIQHISGKMNIPADILSQPPRADQGDNDNQQVTILREWHGFPKPVRVTGAGTKGYGCGYRSSNPQNPHVPVGTMCSQGCWRLARLWYINNIIKASLLWQRATKSLPRLSHHYPHRTQPCPMS
jgi:RNase H-like domain found in reverse transcriptase